MTEQLKRAGQSRPGNRNAAKAPQEQRKVRVAYYLTEAEAEAAQKAAKAAHERSVSTHARAVYLEALDPPSGSQWRVTEVSGRLYVEHQREAVGPGMPVCIEVQTEGDGITDTDRELAMRIAGNLASMRL